MVPCIIDSMKSGNHFKGVSGVVRDAGNKAARNKTKHAAGKGKKKAVPVVIKMDVAIQTENDIITDENPLFRAVGLFTYYYTGLV